MAASDGEHPRKWWYTWEAQSHIPTLRLLLFARDANPFLQCYNLKVQLHLPQSLVVVSWFEDALVSLRVPIPRVLVDVESPLSFRALDDHIEVKLLLLLPVDHPIVSSFDSVLNLSEDRENVLPDVSKPLVMESDVKKLSSRGEVHFYCRSCSFKLTRSPLRSFIEMPSINWREVADNWFGACCCSFGGVSEKLVIKYANSYSCAPGICLLSSTSITLCKDDLMEYNFPEWSGQQECNSKSDKSEEDGLSKATVNSEIYGESSSTSSDAGKMIYNSDESSQFEHSKNENLPVLFRYEDAEKKSNHDCFSHSSPCSNVPEDVAISPSCAHVTSSVSILSNEHCEHHFCETARNEHIDATAMEILANQRSFLNGFLEDIFMARSSNLSEDISWYEVKCPRCMSLLGAYPSCKGYTPVDGGVRLFKCYISTCLPTVGSGNLFRQYTTEKMFANKLMECANDESSFRFVVIDLKTKLPSLQIILINPDTWSCSGYCSIAEDNDVPKLQLQPVIKVLFSECSTATELQLRMIEEWITKNSAENIFMLTCQIKELIGSLMSAKDMYPPSFASLQGLCLSSMPR